MAKAYWLLKTEPDDFSIDDLERAPGRTAAWDGVRNPEARNLLRDGIRAGDRAFLYHSSVTPSSIVGIVEVVRAAYPDPTAFARRSAHFDPKSDPARPTWFAIDVKLVERLPRAVTLDEIKREPALADMVLVRRGRLSVQPVTAAQWRAVLALARRPPRGRPAARR